MTTSKSSKSTGKNNIKTKKTTIKTNPTYQMKEFRIVSGGTGKDYKGKSMQSVAKRIFGPTVNVECVPDRNSPYSHQIVKPVEKKYGSGKELLGVFVKD
ncbi:MAG: hypothetical protein RBR26_10615 [Methanosarcina mazei]|nr:hypothetical protein [Methanosarcina mazei]